MFILVLIYTVQVDGSATDDRSERLAAMCSVDSAEDYTHVAFRLEHSSAKEMTKQMEKAI